MSDRRRVPHLAPRRPPPGRRRTVTALGVVVAVVALAGYVGSRTDHGRDAKTDLVAASVPGEATSDVALSGAAKDAPPTTIPGPSVDEGAPTSAASGSRSSGAGSGSGSTATGSSSGAAGRSPRSAGQGDAVQPKIIRTGSAQLRAERGTFSATVSRLTAIATGAGGFVSSSETNQLGSDPQGTLTLRIPAKAFDSVLADLHELGTVTGVTTSSQDVTGEYTDTAARIKALAEERDQISLVLSHAQTIADILAVRDRLSSVQGELEQLQGRQKVLDDQTSLSTLAITVTERPHHHGVTPPKPPTGLAKVWHQSRHRFAGGAQDITYGAAALAPWAILALVLWLPARLLWRRATVPAGPPAAAGPPAVD